MRREPNPVVLAESADVLERLNCATAEIRLATIAGNFEMRYRKVPDSEVGQGASAGETISKYDANGFLKKWDFSKGRKLSVTVIPEEPDGQLPDMTAEDSVEF